MTNLAYDTPVTRSECEYLRLQTRSKFDNVRATWIDLGRWVLPHRVKWMQAQIQGERSNQHIVDSTHILSLRSYVAGFLEGNTSATRPWYRVGTADPDRNMIPANHEWLDKFTKQTLRALSSANFYHAAGEFYYDYGTFNTGAYYIDELDNGKLFFHVLTPGSYYVLNNAYGEAVVMVREFALTVKALVDYYGKGDNWSNFSSRVKKLYQDGTYTQLIDVVQVIKRNEVFDANKAPGGMNKQWISLTYEFAGGPSMNFVTGQENLSVTEEDKKKYLQVTTSKRKPFIVGRSQTSGNFEYGEKGPTSDALGLIKSLNKKAIAKDQALEQMLRPALQGPSNLRKSYITTASNAFVPLDAHSLAQKGLRTIFEVNPAIGALAGDVQDMRQQVEKHYYADYLLYLSLNPKTRTAKEVDAIVEEKQLVIGPNLQSLNWTHNIPVVDYVMDYVLDEDPHLPPPPAELAGQFLRPDFISIFAQAQRAADLPSIERYMAMITNVGQLNPRIWDKANLDKLADIFEDRLYLPAGLNRDQAKTDAIREQNQAMAERQQKVEQMSQMAGAMKDIGVQIKPQGEKR